LRLGWLAVLAAALTLPVASGPVAAAGRPPTAGPVAHAARTTTLPAGYDLVSPYGGVHAFGGAGYWGGTTAIGLKAPVVSIAPLPDGKGYWLVSSDGGVFSFGAAHFWGSTGRIHLNAPIVGIVAAADGDGYWLVARDGGIFSFGPGVHFYGSTGGIHLSAPIVGMAATSDGHGYWLVASDGGIFTFGDAHFYGSAAGFRLDTPIVGMAAAPGRAGYWVVSATGGVYAFGAIHWYGTAVAALAGSSTSAVGIAAVPDGRGYWIAASKGRVFEFGNAPFRGSAAPRTGIPTASIAEATAVRIAPPSPYPAHSLGYDINWPQCSGGTGTVPLPGESGHAAGASAYTVAVVGVDGWAVDSPNPCLTAEVTWARHATGTGYASYNLYMLLNAPASTSTADQSGPDGKCASERGSTTQDNCYAYNYGWNAASIAHSYASSEGASSQVWWLDIENTSCSSSNFNGGYGEPWSCDTHLNDLTLDAAIASLRSYGITVGIYCTYDQWAAIMGVGFVPPGPQVPIWIAGATWTSPPYPQGWAGNSYPGPAAAEPYCEDTGYRFAGGIPWMLQETPGDTNYPYDPDFSCGTEAYYNKAVRPPAHAPSAGPGAEMPVQVHSTPQPG
jgi:hypothetical protein